MNSITQNKKVIYSLLGIGSLIGIAVAIILMAMPGVSVGDVRSQLAPAYPSGQTIATTTPTYQTPGTATSTLTADLGLRGQSGTIADGATLKIMLAGSSTLSTLNFDVQYSDNNIDWFPESLAWNVRNAVASTSPSVSTVNTYVYNFASSTANRLAVTNANSATSTRIVNIETIPARYIRILFYTPIGSSNLAFWAQLVPYKQQN